MFDNQKIKFCVWDVGQVIYKYSLQDLNDFMKSNSKNLDMFEKNQGVLRFDYNPFMRGEVDFAFICRQLCQWCGVEYYPGIVDEMDAAFHDGVGDFFEPTKKLMKEMKQSGIKNCILSNALSNLKDTANIFGLVDEAQVFCSSDLGLLKPAPKIYEKVRDILGCEYHEMIFIDDKVKNVEAALALGIHAIIFDEKTIEVEINKIF